MHIEICPYFDNNFGKARYKQTLQNMKLQLQAPIYILSFTVLRNLYQVKILINVNSQAYVNKLVVCIYLVRDYVTILQQVKNKKQASPTGAAARLLVKKVFFSNFHRPGCRCLFLIVVNIANSQVTILVNILFI